MCVYIYMCVSFIKLSLTTSFLITVRILYIIIFYRERVCLCVCVCVYVIRKKRNTGIQCLTLGNSSNVLRRRLIIT